MSSSSLPNIDCLVNIASYCNQSRDVVNLFSVNKWYRSHLNAISMDKVWKAFVSKEFAFDWEEHLHFKNLDKELRHRIDTSFYDDDMFIDNETIHELDQELRDLWTEVYPSSDASRYDDTMPHDDTMLHDTTKMRLENSIQQYESTSFALQLGDGVQMTYFELYKRLHIRFRRFQQHFLSIYVPLLEFKRYFIKHGHYLETEWVNFLDLTRFALGHYENRFLLAQKLYGEEFLDLQLYMILSEGQTYPDQIDATPVFGTLSFYDHKFDGFLLTMKYSQEEYPFFCRLDQFRVYITESLKSDEAILEKGQIAWFTSQSCIISRTFGEYLNILAKQLIDYNLGFTSMEGHLQRKEASVLNRFPRGVHLQNNPSLMKIGSKETTNGVTIEANAIHIPYLSTERESFFAYCITISMDINVDSQKNCDLESRHWIIDDGNGNITEVEGEGVIGHFPKMSPGATFTYSSVCPIERSSRNSAISKASMRGSFRFRNAHTGQSFDAKVGRFPLTEEIFFI